MTAGDLWCRLTLFAPDGSAVGSWTLRGEGAPDIGTVDRLARVFLAARSVGCTAVLTDAAPALADVFELAGLGALHGQMRRESERGEHPRHGALERREPADLPAGDLEDL